MAFTAVPHKCHIWTRLLVQEEFSLMGKGMMSCSHASMLLAGMTLVTTLGGMAIEAKFFN